MCPLHYLILVHVHVHDKLADANQLWHGCRGINHLHQVLPVMQSVRVVVLPMVNYTPLYLPSAALLAWVHAFSRNM